MVTALFRTVVEHNVETSRQRDYQFFLPVERVAETLLAARHVVDPVCARNRERDNPAVLKKRQVAARIADLRQVDMSCCFKAQSRLLCFVSLLQSKNISANPQNLSSSVLQKQLVDVLMRELLKRQTSNKRQEPHAEASGSCLFSQTKFTS